MTGTEQLYCDGPGQDPGDECGRPVAGHGGGETGTPKCQTHLKQLQRTGKMTPIAEKVSAEERAINACSEMLEADSDEDYARTRRAFITACLALRGKEAEQMRSFGDLADEIRRRRSIEIKRGLEAARARGVRLGRPPRVSDAEIRRLFEWLKSGSAVARALNMHQASVNERLGKLFGKRKISSSSAPASPPST